MLGAAYWQRKSGAREAIESWSRCQEHLTNLVSDADRVNSDDHRKKKVLYEYLLVILKLVIENKVDAYSKLI
jgi:hypothetical protein